ncbi:MAG TPA: hypothetical protein PLA94_06760 [Myxococcota bacterium]|nr:hypothetical protein [Myxococcota bacterium]
MQLVGRPTLGAFWLAKGIFDLLIFGLACLWFVLMGGVAALSGDHEGQIIGGVFIGMSTFAFLFVLVISLPNFVVAYGLIRQRPWGDLGAILLAMLNLFHFPIGSILGGVTLAVVLKKKD